MRAEILTYSRARGVFGGLVLNGSTLRPDNEDNTKIYGKAVEHKVILTGGVLVPAAAKPLIADIRKYATPPAVKKSTKKAPAK
jgi:SH3 domain-containing YSC84-like protein 1